MTSVNSNLSSSISSLFNKYKEAAKDKTKAEPETTAEEKQLLGDSSICDFFEHTTIVTKDGEKSILDLVGIGNGSGQRKLEDVKNFFDINGDGGVTAEDFEELNDVLKDVTSIGKKNENFFKQLGDSFSLEISSHWTNVFDQYDVNGDGYIDSKDKKAVRQNIGKTGSASLENYDIDGNGKIDNEDYYSIDDMLDELRDDFDSKKTNLSSFREYKTDTEEVMADYSNFLTATLRKNEKLNSIADLLSKIDANNDSSLKRLEWSTAETWDIDGDLVADKALIDKLWDAVESDDDFITKVKAGNVGVFSDAQMEVIDEIYSALQAGKIVTDYKTLFAQITSDGVYAGIDAGLLKSSLVSATESGSVSNPVSYTKDGKKVSIWLNDNKSIKYVSYNGEKPFSLEKDGTKLVKTVYTDLTSDEKGNLTGDTAKKTTYTANDKEVTVVDSTAGTTKKYTLTTAVKSLASTPDVTSAAMTSYSGNGISIEGAIACSKFNETSKTLFDGDKAITLKSGDTVTVRGTDKIVVTTSSGETVYKLDGSSYDPEPAYPELFAQIKEGGLYAEIDEDKVKTALEENPDTNQIKYTDANNNTVLLTLNTDKTIKSVCFKQDGEFVKVSITTQGSKTIKTVAHAQKNPAEADWSELQTDPAVTTYTIEGTKLTVNHTGVGVASSTKEYTVAANTKTGLFTNTEISNINPTKITYGNIIVEGENATKLFTEPATASGKPYLKFSDTQKVELDSTDNVTVNSDGKIVVTKADKTFKIYNTNGTEYSVDTDPNYERLMVQIGTSGMYSQIDDDAVKNYLAQNSGATTIIYTKDNKTVTIKLDSNNTIQYVSTGGAPFSLSNNGKTKTVYTDVSYNATTKTWSGDENIRTVYTVSGSELTVTETTVAQNENELQVCCGNSYTPSNVRKESISNKLGKTDVNWNSILFVDNTVYQASDSITLTSELRNWFSDMFGYAIPDSCNAIVLTQEQQSGSVYKRGTTTYETSTTVSTSKYDYKSGVNPPTNLYNDINSSDIEMKSYNKDNISVSGKTACSKLSSDKTKLEFGTSPTNRSITLTSGMSVTESDGNIVVQTSSSSGTTTYNPTSGAICGYNKDNISVIGEEVCSKYNPDTKVLTLGSTSMTLQSGDKVEFIDGKIQITRSGSVIGIYNTDGSCASVLSSDGKTLTFSSGSTINLYSHPWGYSGGSYYTPTINSDGTVTLSYKYSSALSYKVDSDGTKCRRTIGSYEYIYSPSNLALIGWNYLG